MVIAWSGFGQETILRKNSKGVLESVEFSTEDKRVVVPATAEVFFKDMLGIEPTDEFRKMDARKQRQKEFVHEHFEQYYKGVKVEGGGYNFHYKNGRMYFAHGHYIDIGDINTQPSITKREAMESFAGYKNIPLKDIDDYLAELIIKEIPAKNDTVPMLVYKIYLYADYRHNTDIGFVDAYTREVVFTEPALIDFSAIGTFTTRYSGIQQGITHHYQGGYHLVDSTRGAIIHTWNLEGRTNILTRVELTDNDNNWTQAEHRPDNNDMGLDVQWALQSIYDRLHNTHGINSMDDNGFTVNAHIRDGTDPDNAFWNTIERTLSFGEGGRNFRSLASVDVVAHEFGHGITHFQIGWNNTTDQRAFNEGMSDIWGIMMEYRIRPNSVWQIGEQLTRNHDCLRNIEDTNANNAMNRIANTFGSTQYNSGDSYVRGGILSHWFYLLVNGATGTNDLGRNYTVHGVGMDLAENLVVKAVFDEYLRNTTSYAQIRTSMVNAARALAGEDSYLVYQIENAWYAVGVGNVQYQYSISGPSSVCDQATYSINNFPSGATVEWSVDGALRLDSAQNSTVTVSKTWNGKARINADISIGGNTIHLSTGDFWVGIPAGFEIVGPTTLSTGHNGIPVQYVIKEWNLSPHSQGITSVNWTSTPNVGFAYSTSGQYDAWVLGLAAGDGAIYFHATNSCGTCTTDFLVWITNRGFLLYPNPATDMVTVELQEVQPGNDGVSTQRAVGLASTGPYEIQLWSASSMIRRYTTDQPVYHISVSGLPAGIYFVRVIKDRETVTKKLIKR